MSNLILRQTAAELIKNLCQNKKIKIPYDLK